MRRRASLLWSQCKKTLQRWQARFATSDSWPRFEYQNETANDRWIVEHVFPGLRGGYFIEAGAANGKAASSCYVLEKKLGWTGVCIEPHPAFFAELVRNRPLSRCYQVCLGESEGEAEFMLGKAGTSEAYFSGLVASLEQFKAGAREGILQTGTLLRIPVKTLEQVLVEARAPAVIDYAAFDIEGSEIAVFRTFPFARYRFRAISVECDCEAPAELLTSKGYREVTNPFNQNMPWERYWLSDGPD